MGQRCAAVGLLVTVLVLLAGPTASACVTDDWVTIEATAGSGPGTVVPVQGGGFEPRAVELRWNGMGGELLGVVDAGSDGRFAATVVVPAAAVAGRYAVVAVQPAAGGTRGWAYADLVLAAPVPPVEPVSSAPATPRQPWGYLVGTLLLAAVLALVVGARRRKLAGAARLETELDRLVGEERTPVGSSDTGPR